MQRKRLLGLVLVCALLVVLSGLAVGHHHPEHFPLADYTDPETALEDTPLHWQAIYYIWGFHDRWHYIFILLMLYTCYHFRFFYGRNVLRHPGKCTWDRDPGYEGERALMKWHRFFWRANVLLILIHAHEWLVGLVTLYTHGEFTYIWWPLDTDTVVQQGIGAFPAWQQGIGIAIEGFYLFALALWLGSCHFFRYLGAWEWGPGNQYCCKAEAEGCACGTEGVDKPWIQRMNQEHGIFMWMAILASILLILVGGHL